MNRSGWLCLVAGLLLSLPMAFAKEGGKGGNKEHVEKAPLMSVEAMDEKLGDLKMTDEQKTKVTGLREEVLKKLAEVDAKDEVKAAKEELKKAKEGGDEAAIKAAAVKVKEVMGGFNPTHEFRAGLENILSAEQSAKLFPPHEAKGGEEKPGKEGKGKKKGVLTPD
jgi:hypothetical protein